MRGFGIFLMIVSGALDIVSMTMIGSSSFKSFQTVLIISSVAFFIGLLMAIFGRKKQSAKLASKFAQLGLLKGKKYSEIQMAVGNSNAVTTKISKDGQTIKVMQWITSGYHIVLLFDENDTCLGVSHEASI